MTNPSPFEVARTIGNNFSQASRRVKDENAIEKILSESLASGNPEVIQNNIGKILSQVSPERQGAAVQYLQSAYENVKDKQIRERQRKAAQEVGINADLPEAIQAQQYKEKAKDKRLNDILKPQAGQAPSLENTSQVAGGDGLANLDDATLIRLSGAPDKEISEPAKAALKLRETRFKENRQDIRDAKKESLSYKEELLQRGDIARQSIANKNRQNELIDRGNIDDPTWAIVSENLPLNLGKRMLSNDTVEYKAGLVDDFRDLRNLFQGQTRVKEIEILENKIADIYLTDSQKKAVLKARINANRADLIMAEAAEEADEKFPNLGLVAFRKKVQELAAPKLDALGESVIGETASIINQAETRKKIPLDPVDPDDKKIMISILEEAGGDKQQAKKIAKQKGYTWIGM